MAETEGKGGASIIDGLVAGAAKLAGAGDAQPKESAGGAKQPAGGAKAGAKQATAKQGKGKQAKPQSFWDRLYFAFSFVAAFVQRLALNAKRVRVSADDQESAESALRQKKINTWFPLVLGDRYVFNVTAAQAGLVGLTLGKAGVVYELER